MQAVFLDFGSLGPTDVNPKPLTDQLPELTFYPATSPADVAGRIKDAELVFINKVKLTAELLAGAPNLRMVCIAATGTDNVDLAAARERGITVCNIRDYCTPSVAQHVFALLLALTQRVLPYRRFVERGGWSTSEHFCALDFPTRELAGKTLGIVGYGKLGRGVAELGRAFGMQLLVARQPYRIRDHELLYAIGDRPTRVGLGTLLERADVVSLHCPLNKQTAELIDAAALAKMRDSAVLINTARGGLIDDAALIAALESGRLAGAGIDVLSEEPPARNAPLVSAHLDNLIVTPHIAWAAREARQRAIDQMAEVVAAFLGGEPINRVT